MCANQRIDQHVLDQFKVLKKLGSGAYGHVWRVTNGSGEVFALKKVFEAFQHSTDAQRTFREISVLRKLDHPNIIRLHEVFNSQQGRDVYLLMEHMSTDLYHAIYESTLEEVHRKYILYQLLLALYYLHSARLIHRDLKPSNMLLSAQCHVKLCDFGLVRHMGDEKETVVMTQGVATRWYRAPQLLLGSQNYTEKVDLWSVGCILAEMLTKAPLFNCPSTITQLEKMLQVTGRPSWEEIDELGSQAATVIRQCSIKPKTPKELFGATIDQSCLDLLLNLLRFSSNKRFSAEQALRHPYLKDFFREADLLSFSGQIKLEVQDSIQLTPEAYRELITKHFVARQQPQRFGDLRREKSQESRPSSRPTSGKRKNLHLFGEILREKESSAKHVTRLIMPGKENIMTKQNMASKEKGMSKEKIKEKEDILGKSNLICKQPSSQTPNLQQFQSKIKPAGTFAALRKATNTMNLRR